MSINLTLPCHFPLCVRIMIILEIPESVVNLARCYQADLAKLTRRQNTGRESTQESLDSTSSCRVDWSRHVHDGIRWEENANTSSK